MTSECFGDGKMDPRGRHKILAALFLRLESRHVKPVLQALLLADHIYQDLTTGKKIISGTFNKLSFQRKSPPKETEINGLKHVIVAGGMNPGSPYAYVSLTEVRGTVPCVLRYVDLENDNSLLECRFSIQCDDPLVTVELILPLPPLPIVKAGIHSLELLCDGEPIGSLRIQVEEQQDGNITA